MKKGVRLTKNQFTEKALRVHGDKYEYSSVIYINTDTKVSIICKKHGKFLQTPHNHLGSKQGCPKCKSIKHINRSKGSTESFTKRAKIIHKNKYDYSLVDYENSKKKIAIICPEHGIFKQTPNNHIRFHGCPTCGSIETIRKNKENPMGWKTSDWIRVANKSKVFDSFKVYIIKCWRDNEEFFKIGKTFTTVKYRFKCKNEMPYNWKVIKMFKGEAEEMSKLEKKLQKENKELKYIPEIKFLGSQECFKKIEYGN